jgi:hypothetical protein
VEPPIDRFLPSFPLQEEEEEGKKIKLKKLLLLSKIH